MTLRVQLFPAARLLPQLLVWTKSTLGLTVKPEIVICALPLLVSVTVCGPLVVPTGCSPKVKLGVDSVAAGPTPVPLS